jgi:hypothetical protein
MRLFAVALILVAGTHAFPTRLTEEQFLSATNDADAAPVDIVSGYAQVSTYLHSPGWIARFFLLEHTKMGGNIPNDNKIYQMGIKMYTK